MSVDDLDDLFPPKPKPLRLLYFDVETAPMLAFIWRLKTDYVGTHMLEHESFLLSWAARWSDGNKVLSGVLTPAEAKAQDDSRIVKSLSQLIRKADYVVAHNGDRFDLPVVNGRVLVNGLDPLGNVQSIDTLKVARASFKLASNKLDYLAGLLGVGHKHGTSFDLWRQCYAGHGPSLKKMVAYNKQDVVLQEEVFWALVPYAKTLPRLVEFVEWRQEACPYCGSDSRTKTGLHRTKAGSAQKYVCDDCGREHRHWQTIGNKKAGSIGL